MEFHELLERINQFNASNDNTKKIDNIIKNTLPKSTKDIKGNEYELSQHKWKIGLYEYRQKLKDAKNGIVKKEFSEENSLDDINDILSSIELSKEWNKIKYQYKKKLLAKYVSKINLDESQLKLIHNILNKNLKENSIKQKDIIYDHIKKEILSIPFLEKKFNFNIQ